MINEAQNILNSAVGGKITLNLSATFKRRDDIRVVGPGLSLLSLGDSSGYYYKDIDVSVRNG